MSVPVDSQQVADILAVLPESERAGLNLATPTKGSDEPMNDDGVPRQIKEKIARLVANAVATSPEQGQISMSAQMLSRLSDLPRLLNDIENPLDDSVRREATEQVCTFTCSGAILLSMVPNSRHKYGPWTPFLELSHNPPPLSSLPLVPKARSWELFRLQRPPNKRERVHAD